MNPRQTDIEIGVALGVDPKEVGKIRAEMEPTKKTAAKKVPIKKAHAAKKVAKKQSFEAFDTGNREAKFYYRTPEGFVRELSRVNTSQDLVLLEEKKAS